MRKTLNYLHIACVTVGLLAVNMGFVAWHWERVAMTQYAFFPLVLAVFVIIYGVISCVFKHKGNYLIIQRRRGFGIFSEDQDYTFTDAYERRFRWMLLVYCVPIPFYIPVMAFAATWPQTFWALFLFVLPQLVYVVNAIYQTVQEYKRKKQERERLERERIEQERREEQGYWK